MNEFDVIVVGGGPAGATVATRCAQRGLSVALFEHARFPRHKVCGDVINPNCWPVLERLGVAEKVRALPQQKIDGALFTTPGNNAVPVPAPPAMVAIRRSILDSCLLEFAKCCGVIVFEGETVHELTVRNEIITRAGRYLSRTGIVGADGRHSLVARMSGLTSMSRRTNGCVAFQSHFRAPVTLDARVQLHLFPGGYCGLVRVDEERANLCIVTHQRDARFHNDCEALFAHTVRHNPHFRALDIAPEPIGPLHSAHPLCAPMNVPAKKRVFLVGDALRVMEPFTGQGIFFALRTGELAADALVNSQRPEAFYAAAVARLYRQRARTNEWLRRLMYHHRAAHVVIGALRRWPRMLSGVADNVLGEARRFG